MVSLTFSNYEQSLTSLAFLSLEVSKTKNFQIFMLLWNRKVFRPEDFYRVRKPFLHMMNGNKKWH